EKDLDVILDARPDILNHNLETVRRLQRRVRPQATYERSLSVLTYAKAHGFVTKSSLMLGLGEEESEIGEALRDLRQCRTDILTLGQYLQPSLKHLPVERWVSPGEFAAWKERARDMGFRHVESGPLVRSSYHADENPISV
ncbi:MAG: lipoyl synthase, partial [Verrucomicrobiae bacterium]|nr:lipoyl synthase [Verrucomicrobiae bacterium]